MGLAQSALILLGIGIISEKFGAGVGLGELGTGIKTLAAAPLGGVGAGLFEFSGGLRAFGEALGDIGRGFGELFKNIPKYGWKGFPPQQPPAISPNGNGNGLITVSGGDPTTYLPGGGGNVPTNGPVLIPVGPVTSYGQLTSIFQGIPTPGQIQSLIDPYNLTSVRAGNLV